MIAPLPPGFLKSYQDLHHEAAWPVLLLTKLAEDTEWRTSRTARSRPKVVGFDGIPASIIRQVCLPIAKRSLPKIGGRRSPTVRCHGLFPKEACLPTRCRWFRPLAEAILLQVPTFETGFGGSFFSSRIPKLPKLSSMSSTLRSHEDVLFRRSQSASPGIHSALYGPGCRVDRHVRCARPEWLRSLCRSVSRINAAGLESTPPSPGACRWAHQLRIPVSLRLGASSNQVGAVSFTRAEVLPESMGAVPPSRVRPVPWTTTALSLPPGPTGAFSCLPKQLVCCLLEASTLRTSPRVVLSPEPGLPETMIETSSS